MRVLTGLESYRPGIGRSLVLGLGNFDGVHLGHQALIRAVVEQARRLGGESALLTFREHPQSVLHPDRRPPLLTSPEQKFFLLDELGVDTCFVVNFSETFSKIEPESFVRDILAGQLCAREIYLGYNAHFGHNRQGDTGLMRRLAGRYGFRFEEVKPVQVDGDFVSSTRIRSLIQAGELEKMSACLGRPFSVFARVVKGDGRGRTIGYPTANLEVQSDLMPPEGVYAVSIRLVNWDWQPADGAGVREFRCRLEDPRLLGVLNYGRRPTFMPGTGEGPSIEVHLPDFEGDLYGKNLEITFCTCLRKEKRFENSQALKNQIAIDIQNARRLCGTVPKKGFTKSRA